MAYGVSASSSRRGAVGPMDSQGVNEMDSYGDVVGVLVVVAMVRVGWALARSAWREAARPLPGVVLDLRTAPSDERNR